MTAVAAFDGGVGNTSSASEAFEIGTDTSGVDHSGIFTSAVSSDADTSARTPRAHGNTTLNSSGDPMNSKNQEVLEEAGSDYQPAHEELVEYARWLGVKPEEDDDLLWIARKGLSASLPEGWKPCRTGDGQVYYFNFSTGESAWDHPCDAQFRGTVEEEREKLRAAREETRSGSGSAACASDSSAAGGRASVGPSSGSSESGGDTRRSDDDDDGDGGGMTAADDKPSEHASSVDTGTSRSYGDGSFEADAADEVDGDGDGDGDAPPPTHTPPPSARKATKKQSNRSSRSSPTPPAAGTPSPRKAGRTVGAPRATARDPTRTPLGRVDVNASRQGGHRGAGDAVEHKSQHQQPPPPPLKLDLAAAAVSARDPSPTSIIDAAEAPSPTDASAAAPTAGEDAQTDADAVDDVLVAPSSRPAPFPAVTNNVIDAADEDDYSVDAGNAGDRSTSSADTTPLDYSTPRDDTSAADSQCLSLDGGGRGRGGGGGSKGGDSAGASFVREVVDVSRGTNDSLLSVEQSADAEDVTAAAFGGGGGGGATFAREILPILAPRVRAYMSRAEEIRKAQATIVSLRETESKKAEEWSYSVDSSVKVRELERTMDMLSADMNEALEEFKDFSGSPDRVLVALAAGLCIVVYGNFAARELLPSPVALPLSSTSPSLSSSSSSSSPSSSSGDGGGDAGGGGAAGVEDAGSPRSHLPMYELPREPSELAALWTKLTYLITVDSSVPSPQRVSSGAVSPGPCGPDEGDGDGGGGGGGGDGDGGENVSFPETGTGTDEDGGPASASFSSQPTVSRASSPGGGALAFRDRSKPFPTMTQMIAAVQERVMRGESDGVDGEGDGGVGQFFPWLDRMVAEELTLDAVSRSAGPAGALSTLSCWLGGLLVLRAQRSEKEEVRRETAPKAAAAEAAARREARTAGRAGAGAGAGAGKDATSEAAGAADADQPQAPGDVGRSVDTRGAVDEDPSSALESRAKENLAKVAASDSPE